MVISFGKSPELQPLEFYESEIECVNTIELLQVIISPDLKWRANTMYITEKCLKEVVLPAMFNEIWPVSSRY